MPLHENTLLVSLHMKQISVSRKDTDVSNKVTEQHHARKAAGAFHKRLFTDDALKPFKLSFRAARKIHEKLTLPFEPGLRILPASALEKYNRKIDNLAMDVELDALDFRDCYDDHLAAAREMLGDMFDRDLYPEADEVTAAFAIEKNIIPMPTPKVINRFMPDEVRQTLEEQIGERMQRAENAAREDLAKRITTPLSALTERLKDPNNVFRDSLVTNLTEITNLIPTLNITNDPALEAVRTDILANLNVEAETLRTDLAARENAVRHAGRLVRRLNLPIGGNNTNTDQAPSAAAM